MFTYTSNFLLIRVNFSNLHQPECRGQGRDGLGHEGDVGVDLEVVDERGQSGVTLNSRQWLRTILEKNKGLGGAA